MHISHSILIFVAIAYPHLVRAEGGADGVATPPAAPVAGTIEKPPTPEEIADFIKKAAEELDILRKEAVIDPKIRENGDKVVKAVDAAIELKPTPFEEAEEEQRRRRRLWRRGSYSKEKPYLTPGKKVVLKTQPGVVYKIEDKLGGGTYGEVYRAELVKGSDPPQKVALKSCPRYYTQDNGVKEVSRDYESLQLEFTLLNEIFKRDGSCREFLVNPISKIQTPTIGLMSMELAEYGSLHTYVKKGTLDDRKYFPSLINEMIYGLVCMYKTGYSHGDLKNDNILVRKRPDNSPQAIVADLGFATTLTTPFRGPGTRIYSPPEAFTKSRNIDKALVDAFSLGAIIVSMYTKTVPPRTHTEVDGKYIYGPIGFTKKLFQDFGFPIMAADLVQRLCWPDPAKRMTLAQALEHPFLQKSVKPDEYLKKNPFPVDPAGKVNYVVHSAMAAYGIYSSVAKSMDIPSDMLAGLTSYTSNLPTTGTTETTPAPVQAGPGAATVYTIPKVQGSSTSTMPAQAFPQGLHKSDLSSDSTPPTVPMPKPAQAQSGTVYTIPKVQGSSSDSTPSTVPMPKPAQAQSGTVYTIPKVGSSVDSTPSTVPMPKPAQAQSGTVYTIPKVQGSSSDSTPSTVPMPKPAQPQSGTVYTIAKVGSSSDSTPSTVPMPKPAQAGTESSSTSVKKTPESTKTSDSALSASIRSSSV